MAFYIELFNQFYFVFFYQFYIDFYTIMQDNIEYIPNMLKLAKECKVDTYCLVPLMASSDDKYVQAEDITAKEKNALIQKKEQDAKK